MPATTVQFEPLRGLNRLLAILGQENSGAWLRFLLAALGLAAAFALAIFSTAASQTGNTAATVLLASASLLMAAGVGLGTVPYLARRIARKQVREALDFEVTRAGAIYAFVVLLIGFACLNTGNNLLYIILAAMLAAIFVSGVTSTLNLRGLELELRIPNHIFAGSDVPATICVRNRRHWTPSLSIATVPAEKVRNRKRWRWVATTFPIPPWRPPERQWLQLPDRKLRRVMVESSGVFHESAYFPLLLPGVQLQAEVRLRFRRRGRYQERFSLSTRFPFAFLVKTRRLALSREVLVYPELTNSEEVVELLPVLSGKCETYLRGQGTDLYRIRDYLPEDSARHVDWKATAKSGALKVREYAREDERRLRVVFDNPEPGELSPPAYERMVSVVASAVWRLTQQNVFLSFVSQQFRATGDVYGFLEYLATIAPATQASVLDSLEGSTDYSLIFTAAKPGTIPANLWASGYFVFMK